MLVIKEVFSFLLEAANLLDVCMYRGRPLWRCPWDRAFQLAKGRDPAVSWVQYPNPAAPSAPRHSSWIILTH